jgi:hypothetical protein
VTHSSIYDLSATLAEFKGSDVSRLAIELLSALEAAYLDDLRHISPTELVGKQASLKQLVALREVFKGNATNPRV